MKNLLVLVVLVAASCSNSSGPETFTSIEVTESTLGAPAAETTSTVAAPETTDSVTDDPLVPGPLASFAIDKIQLDGQELLVAIADTADLRRQGLMNVPDLLDLDGMLFVFDVDGTGGFWMRDTLIPLDIAFFDVSGAFVDGFLMEPCTTSECPTYRSSGPYRYALEMAEGEMPANPEELGTPGIWIGEES